MAISRSEGRQGRVSELWAQYIQALVGGSVRAADRAVEAALGEGYTPQRIYLELLQPAAYELGRRWQENTISVAQEHRATAIVEQQMGELHPLFRSRAENGRTFVIGCAPGEWHRVGARMVADFFEAEGWDVHYLGAAVPVRDMVGLVREADADMVGVSAHMLFNLPQVDELARALRVAGLSDIPVIAGGRPFEGRPGLAGRLNVAGSANDAAEAVRLAERVVGGQALRSRAAVEALGGLALGRARDGLAAAATERTMVLEPGLDETEVARVQAGFQMVTRMLEAALALGDAELLDEQMRWSFERSPHDGVTSQQLLSRLTTYAATTHDLVRGADSAIIDGYIARLIAAQRRLMGF